MKFLVLAPLIIVTISAFILWSVIMYVTIKDYFDKYSSKDVMIIQSIVFIFLYAICALAAVFAYYIY